MIYDYQESRGLQRAGSGAETRPGPKFRAGSGPANFILKTPGPGPGWQIFIEKKSGPGPGLRCKPGFFLILAEIMIWPELSLHLY